MRRSTTLPTVSLIPSLERDLSSSGVSESRSLEWIRDLISNHRSAPEVGREGGRGVVRDPIGYAVFPAAADFVPVALSTKFRKTRSSSPARSLTNGRPRFTAAVTADEEGIDSKIGMLSVC